MRAFEVDLISTVREDALGLLVEEQRMTISKVERHDPASFVLVISILGALVGVITGYGLQELLSGTRLLALLAAFFAVAITSIFRSYLGRLSRSLRLRKHDAKVPLYLWLSICLSTVIGGLAGHDLCESFDVSSGPVVGFVSGVLASLCMALLMVLFFHEHPEDHLEF